MCSNHDDFNKNMNDLNQFLDESADKFGKIASEAAKNFQSSWSVEKKKLELKSQIGEHQRNIDKAYARLGKAYYDSVKKGKTDQNLNDLMDLISTNQKVVDLLNEQLKRMDEEKK